MKNMTNDSLLQLVHDLMHNFDELFERNYKQPINEFENWIGLKEEALAKALSKVFKNNASYTRTVMSLVADMDELVGEQISDDTICCNRNMTPFLTVKGFQHSYSMGRNVSGVKHQTILHSVFNQEDLNDWVDKESNFDFPTKEIVKQGAKTAYENSTRNFANGVDWRYIDVILYLIDFFESYNRHIARYNEED